ncbi:MAG: hypothetical protein ABWK05_04210 [Pyrobaculum sp.]
MRGQALILAGLVLSFAVAVVLFAYSSLLKMPSSSPASGGLGYIAASWPDYVKALGRYLDYSASIASFALGRSALDVGLYGRPGDAKWLQFNETAKRINASLAGLREWLANALIDVAPAPPLYNYGGFNGTLGPYPLAADYSNWNLTILTKGVCGGRFKMRVLGGKYARFVVYSYVDVPTEYVLTYAGHTSDITTLGVGYNEILSDILRMGSLDNKFALFAVDLSNPPCSADLNTFAQWLRSRIQPLPWYAEISTCPFCLLHFRVPPNFLQRNKASEVLIVYGSFNPTTPFAVSDGVNEAPIQIDTPPPSGASNCNPWYVCGSAKAVFPQFFDANDIAGWSKAVVRTTSQCYPNPVSGGVASSGVSVTTDPRYVPPLSIIRASARVYATYLAGTKNYAFNVYKQVSWSASVGFKVEALVLPESTQGIRPARLDLYYQSAPSTTHPICANFYGVQVVNPSIAWAAWRTTSQGGVWNGRTWDWGYSIPSGAQWYLMSVAVGVDGTVRWEVYHYNSTGRPLKLLGYTSRVYSGLSSFYIVLGSAIVDNPGSTSSAWTEAAYYAYVRVRPWVYPEPSVYLAPVGPPPLAYPARNDVVAVDKSELRVRIGAKVNITAALIYGLDAVTSMNASAQLIGFNRVDNVHDVTWVYYVNVSHTQYRAALSSQFFVYYVLGNSPKNRTVDAFSLLQYGDYWAVFNVSFRVPRGASHALLVSVPGSVTARLAVSAAKPRAYYMRIGAQAPYTYYVVNWGDAPIVLYAPWDGVSNFDDGSQYNTGVAGYFGAVYPTTNGRDKWRVIVIPPGGLVKFTSTASDIAGWAPSWARPYLTQIQPPCSQPEVYRVYIPTNITTSYYVVAVDNPSTFTSKMSVWYFIDGSWQQANYLREKDLSDSRTQPRLWVRIEAQPGQLDYKSLLLALCSSGGSEAGFDQVFGKGRWGKVSKGEVPDIGAYANLVQFPDGFSVEVVPSSSAVSVGLSNSTSLPSYRQCSTSWTHVAIYYIDDKQYWWNFDGFCFDRHIWESVGGTPYLFSLSVSRQFVLFRMYDASFEPGKTWKRSYPNAPSIGRALTAFRYVVVGVDFRWVIRPFAWPEPFVVK